jgi:hypothetical protein
VALTLAQRADIRFFCGWSARYHQNDRVELAMNAIDNDAAVLAQFQNGLAPSDGGPPGLIACCRDAMSQLRLAMKRKKASAVGSIQLNEQELEHIRGLGRQYTNQMCATLGVPRKVDVFSGYGANSFANWDGMGSGGGGNYIGK